MPKPLPVPFQDSRAQYDSIRADVALALAGVLERQDFVLGREVAELERQMAALCGTRFAVACASGSDALLLALMALDVRPGDEVLAPTFTFFATAGAVARLGARPVFVDIEPRSFNISPAALKDAADRHPGARAAIPVDLFGQVPEMAAVRAALPEGVPIIEDAAQAVLAEDQGRRAGSHGRVAALSFFPSKNLGGYGDGGMMTTDDEALAARLLCLRVHGSNAATASATADERYLHDEVGLNSRLDTLQAAVLLVKLPRLEAWTAARRRAAERYMDLFVESGLARAGAIYPENAAPVVPPCLAEGPGRRHAWHQYTIRVLRRGGLRAALSAADIATAVYYPVPLHLQKCFAPLGGRPGDCPEAERAAAEVLSLPLFPEITVEQQQRVVEVACDFYLSRSSSAPR